VNARDARLEIQPTEDDMNTLLLKLFLKFREFRDREEGQDMVEYALVVALIALAAVSSMQHVGTALTNRFNSISSAVG
jgi:pilus assembly protein Flp/PilA